MEQKPKSDPNSQTGPNWGLIILVIVMLGMWTGVMVDVYVEWSAA